LLIMSSTSPRFTPDSQPLTLRDWFGNIDIYVFDQILRGRIAPGMRILDAGCGAGRNLVYFLRSGYDVFGVDADAAAVRDAYDAPFAGLGEAGVTGPRQFPLSIPVRDHARGNGDRQAELFDMINATTLPVHFVWGLADNVFTGEWGRSWHARIPHATWDSFDDAAHFLQDTHGSRIAEIVLSK